MKRGAFAAAVFVVSACAGGPGLGPKPPEEKLAPQPTTINLERADPAEILSMAEQLLEEPVLVDATALGSLRCMRVTVKEPNPVPRRAAAEALFEALRARGLRIDRAGGMWLVSIDQARPPMPCELEGRQTAAAEGADAGTDADSDGGAEAAVVVSAYDPQAVLQEILGSIRELSPTERSITQRGLELFLDNHAALLSSSVRFLPEVAVGKPRGLRVFGVKADDLFGRLGLENGDLIESVMGKQVITQDETLRAFGAMRGAKAIELEIRRAGTQKKLIVLVE
jgi:hypothetical protein